jgi:Dolichyl-phosphate-mannose-protein mannosyltransferase
MPRYRPSSDRFRFAARAALLVLGVFVYAFAFQGSRSLWEPDEGRYTNIAVQMLRSGDFLVPAFNDDVRHFAKPPLTYWSVAGGIALLGWNEWGARLSNALAFAATVLALYALAKKVVPERPWLPPLIYASSLFPFVAANVVTTDTLLTLWEAVAVLGFVRWWERRDEPGSRRDLILMWCGFGLAFLTKGPPGLLALAAILLLAGLAGGWRTVRRLPSFPGLLAFAILGFGWYVYVAVTHPGLMGYFLRDEVVGRVASGDFNRNAQWYGAFRVYLPVLIGGTLPWTFVLLGASRRLRRTVFSRPWWRSKLEGDPWPAFLVLWLLLPMTVFTVSRSRLPLYVLPLFVPLALTTGRLMSLRPIPQSRLRLVTAWLLALLAVKGAAAHVPVSRASRPIARAIAAEVPFQPAEIVFVDLRPVWGLSLYLRCEVERVTSLPPLAGAPEDETLAEEVGHAEPGTVFVVGGDQTSRIQETLASLGSPGRVLGEVRSWKLILPVRTEQAAETVVYPSPGPTSVPGRPAHDLRRRSGTPPPLEALRRDPEDPPPFHQGRADAAVRPGPR